MERSMCRSSRMAGALAQLSIIGRARGGNDRGQVHTRRTSAVRADEAPVGLFSASVDLPVDECCGPGPSAAGAATGSECSQGARTFTVTPC